MPTFTITPLSEDEYTVTADHMVDLKFVRRNDQVLVYANGALTLPYSLAERFNGALTPESITAFLVGGGA